MTTVSFTPEQADRALALFAQIRSRPGMWIGRFDWFTAEAFWEGYLCALHDDGLSDFRTWGLAHLGTPETNVHPISQLRRLHGLPTDDATYPSFDRTRAEEIAALVFNLIEDYIRARVKP